MTKAIWSPLTGKQHARHEYQEQRSSLIREYARNHRDKPSESQVRAEFSRRTGIDMDDLPHPSPTR